MSKMVLRWLAPGMATVAVGTLLTVLSTSANIASDLTARSADALMGQGLGWADVAVDGRNVTLSGTAADNAIIGNAVVTLGQVHGIGHVQSRAITAPLSNPYTITATLKDGEVALIGAIHDESLREILVASADAENVDLRLMSGAPDRAEWLRRLNFGLSQLPQFESAEIALKDLDLTITGRAKSPDAYDTLVTTAIPAGMNPVLHIEPAFIAPYQWSASFDGTRVLVEGFAPDASFADRVRMASSGDTPVATAMALASGAPDGFSETAPVLIENLTRLKSGAIVLDDGVLKLTGTPPSIKVAQEVTASATAAGAEVALEAAPVGDYWLTATVGADGKSIVLDGYVPDQAGKDRLAAMLHVDASHLQVAPGAPARFESALEFGLKALSHLKEGRFAVRTSVLTLKGVALSSSDYKAVLAQLEAGAPQGSVLAMAEIKPPAVSPYVWVAAKGLDGTFHFSGNAPDEAFRSQAAEQAGKVSSDTVTLGSGAPDGFAAAATAGIDALKGLEAGRLGYDGTRWALSGTAKSDADRSAIETALAAATDIAAWEIAITSKDAPVAVAEPAVDPAAHAEPETETAPAAEQAIAVGEPSPAQPPVKTEAPVPVAYEFSAVRKDGGAIVFSGDIPAEATRSFLRVISGGGSVEGLELKDRAPEGFVFNAIAGVRTLVTLKSGELRFDGLDWSLKGQAATPEEQQRASAEIAALPDAKMWAADISGPPAIDLCRARVADFSAHTTILFKSGSAVLEPESVAALKQVGVDLQLCPAALVHVEGHTDADGPEDANLALSVARSEAVVAALIEDGVAEERLYAVGYGESTPIADNDTRAGKQANRRIVFTILEAE